MTVLTPDYNSDQQTTTKGLSSTYQRGNQLLLPADHGGKVRTFIGTYTAPAGGIATATIVNLMKVPAGRIISHLSYLSTSDFGSSGTISIGYNRHKKDANGTTVESSIAAIALNVDVSGQAVNKNLMELTGASTAITSVGGLTIEGWADILFQNNGTGGMQAAATLQLVLAMIVD